MSNFAPKLQDATDDELMFMVNELSPTFTVLASDELTRRDLRKLQKTIELSNNHSEKLEIANYKIQKTMMVLTAIGTFIVAFPVLKSIFQWLSVMVSSMNMSLASINMWSSILSGVVAFLISLKVQHLDEKEVKELLKRYKELIP
jgi:hypothetical protein